MWRSTRRNAPVRGRSLEPLGRRRVVIRHLHAHVQLADNGDGNHSITADQGVGVAVYGAQNSGSYGYPGPLDLDVIPS